MSHATLNDVDIQTSRDDSQPPAQELCYLCAYDHGHMTGVPRDIVAQTVEPVFTDDSWDPVWGEPPEYDVTWLSCGHTIDQPHRLH